MPWIVDDVDRFNKGLDPEQKKKWVAVANGALASCLEKGGKQEECEASAVRIANAKFSEYEREMSLVLQEAFITDEYQMILPIGTFYSSKYGKIEISRSFCEQMEDHWRDKVLGNRETFIDTEHDRGAANGWIHDLQVRDDGLYAQIKWTEKGRKLVEDGLYKFFSADIAEAVHIKSGIKVFPVLVAVALTNTPVMNTMPAAHLDEGNDPAHSDGDNNNLEESEMKTLKEILEALFSLGDEEKGKLTDGEKKQVAEYFGFAEVESKNIELSDQVSDLQQKVELQDEKIDLLLNENKEKSKELSEVKKEKQDAEKTDVIEKALSEGKITPKNRADWEELYDKDPEGAKKLLEAQDPVIDLSERGTGDKGQEVQFTAEEKETFDKMGISDETVKEYGGKI